MVLPFKTKKAKNKKTAGLFITPEGISLAIINHTPSTPRLEHTQLYPCTAEQYDSVLSLLAKTHKLDTVNCCFVLGQDEHEFFQVEKPDVETHEIPSALRWSIKDLVTYDIDDVVLDYINLPYGNNIQVVTTQKQIINKRVELMRNSSCHISSIDISNHAARNLIAAMKITNADAIIGLLNLWGNNANIGVFQKGDIYINRSTTIGVEALNIINSEEVNDSDVLDNLAIELQRTFDYFESVHQQAAVNKVVIISNTETIPLLDKLIEERLGIECLSITGKDINQLNLQVLPSQDIISNQCLMAIGGALRTEH